MGKEVVGEELGAVVKNGICESDWVLECSGENRWMLAVVEDAVLPPSFNEDDRPGLVETVGRSIQGSSTSGGGSLVGGTVVPAAEERNCSTGEDGENLDLDKEDLRGEPAEFRAPPGLLN